MGDSRLTFAAYTQVSRLCRSTVNRWTGDAAAEADRDPLGQQQVDDAGEVELSHTRTSPCRS